jgi:hypothetical protein
MPKDWLERGRARLAQGRWKEPGRREGRLEGTGAVTEAQAIALNRGRIPGGAPESEGVEFSRTGDALLISRTAAMH